MITACCDLLSPPICAHCNASLLQRTIFCDRCFATIAPVISLPIRLTKRYVMPVYAVSAYQPPLQKLIVAKRYNMRVAAIELGQLTWQLSGIATKEFDCIIPVPLHWTRYARRWYNQAEVMAQQMSQKSGVPVVSALRRVRATRYQAELDRLVRHENVRGVFSLTQQAEQYRGKRIVLVDDLMTTGATLTQAAKALLALHPASITAVVACRVV
jgi:ComF family protein